MCWCYPSLGCFLPDSTVTSSRLAPHLEDEVSGSCREIILQWTTRDEGAQSARWGTQPGQYMAEANVLTTTTYTAASMCGGVANSTGYIFPGVFHRASLSGLEPGTQYFYTFGSNVSPNVGDDRAFPCMCVWKTGPERHTNLMSIQINLV